MRTTISVSAVAIALLLAGCVTSDHEYGEAVRRHIARGGPKEACCVGLYDNKANEARCEADAVTRCQFVRDATVRVLRVQGFGHDDGAMVDVEVAGPAGRGSCRYQVINYPREGLSIQRGTCTAL